MDEPLYEGDVLEEDLCEVVDRGMLDVDSTELVVAAAEFPDGVLDEVIEDVGAGVVDGVGECVLDGVEVVVWLGVAEGVVVVG